MGEKFGDLGLSGTLMSKWALHVSGQGDWLCAGSMRLGM
jgi:hypothetical protein